MIDITKEVKSILTKFKVDLNHPDFKDTPSRVSKMYNELLAGLGKEKDGRLILDKWFPTDANQMVVFKNHTFSLCPHHLLPVEYDIYVAYIPRRRAVGLSKIPRLCILVGNQPIIQENLTTQICKQIMETIKPKGVAVLVRGRHSCMTMRGVKQKDSSVITSALRGIFETDASAKAEFIELIKMLNN